MHSVLRLGERLLRWSERYTKTDMVYLAGSGWWFNLGAGILSLCSLLLYIVFANVLSKEAYGTYQYLLSAGAIIGAFTLTGMNTAVARSVARGYEGSLRRAVRFQLLCGIVPLLISLAIAGYYAFNANYVLAAGFVVIGIFTPLLNAFNTYGAYFHGLQDFRRGFLYGMAWHLPLYAALIIASFFSGVALILLVVNLVVQTVATAFLYIRVIETRVKNDAHDPETLTYGTHLSVMNLPSAVAYQIDAILAFVYLDAVAVAIYAFATAIPERLTTFLKFLPTAALPRLVGKTGSEIRSALGGARMWWVVLLVLVGVGAYAFLAPILFSFLFPTYAEAVPYSQVYALIFIGVIGSLFVTGLTAEKNTKQLYVFNIVVPILQLVLQLVGVIFYGLWGLIVARVCTVWGSLLLAAVLLFGHKKREESFDVTH